ncbi:MAG: Txe/YoeB family addiction module toxin [Sphingomonas sp.]|uniref:Txe/YoeB family addiction module toxin n=1 Tax=Sphingomonas sp. TaxID=28214 RepID=UPI0017BC6805|nr:Txe/YoeB family addiction module toxin [Sphingomonas sp.]MBA3667303.1 Txe/YoeB family addiction module toxin [Sphingomonas sp.]
MKLVFSGRAWTHYLYWQERDAKLLARLNALIEECRRQPFKGTGKPEPLGGNLADWWSRRINGEHRLVYRASGMGDAQTLEIAQSRYHY